MVSVPQIHMLPPSRAGHALGLAEVRFHFQATDYALLWD